MTLRTDPAAGRRRRGLGTTFLILTVVICLPGAHPAEAKEIKGLWYFGGDLAFHSTQDTIRSNADLPGDPRPDDFASREITIEDTLSYGLTAGFGLTRSLSLQLDVGYFRGQVGPTDGYFQDAFPVATDPVNPTVLNTFRRRQTTLSFNAGTLTEIPVTLSGIVRFRPDRALNPYLGVGAGLIFAGVEPTDDIGAFDERLAHLRIRGEKDEFGNDLVPEAYELLRTDGKIPFTYPMTVSVKDALEWHVTGGFEYFLNDRYSLVADLRYTVAPQSVVIDLGGQDQVNLSIWSEKLFRSDGSLKIFNAGGEPPNPILNPNDPQSPRATCRAGTVGDFDNDGHKDDLCYNNNPNLKTDNPVGTIVVQGGSIDLSGFSARMALRVYF